MHVTNSAARAIRGDRSTAGARARSRLITAVAVCATVLAGLALAPAPAFASSVTSASFSGGAGTTTVGGMLYAKSGGALTLSVSTSTDTKCVDVSGAFATHAQSSTAKSSWTFTTTAGAGDGSQSVTVFASPSFNAQSKCTGSTGSATASYTLDNTGPVVTAALTPAANAAGWNNTSTQVAWTAIDAGAGLAGAQPFQTDTVAANGIATKTAPAQTDRLGNTGGAGSVTVRIDKGAPTIAASQAENADGTTTIAFTCNDSVSGIGTCLADGSTTNSRTVQPGVTVTGTAIDNAGNTSVASSTAPVGDTTPPTLSGTPTTEPNGNGWYAGDVTVHWAAADPQSGVPAHPADTTIAGEGTGLTSTTSVTNGAGLSTTATSSPAVRIDRTAPTTGVTGTSNGWVDGDVTVSLSAGDNLSGVARTEYSVDGGATQSGSSFTLTSEGDHSVTFSSTDRAGNAETAQTVHVRIDRTAPTIGHAFTPLSYTDGTWTNEAVTVTFSCADQGGSGVASCTAPVTKSAEGSYTVTGTATDGAGSTATDTASVKIDKTAPSLTGQPDREPNGAGWYDHDVTVGFTASDDLSGVTGATASKTLGEGGDQSATGTAVDAAGNSATTTVSGIHVDKTDPVLTGSFAGGWHTGDVTVHWSCTDALSGVRTRPADTLVEGEGDNLSATSTCTDLAGNATTKTATGIKIDRAAPTTTADVPQPLDSGWYGGDVEVTLHGSDGLSGIDTTYYTVDDGTAKAYDGAFAFGTEGTHTIAFWSSDSAGNVEQAGAPLELKIDKTAPTTTVVNPVSPDSGWFVTSGIPVAFGAGDAGGSGVLATYYTIDGGTRQTYGEPFTADLSTGSHTITYWSVDLADNVEAHATTNTVAVNVDTDAPTITGRATPSANGFGWNNTDVDVAFSCDDIGSGLQTGVAGCAGDTTLTNEGAGQSAHGDALDAAGNRGGADVTDINIDKTRPTLVGMPTGANGAGWARADVTVGWVGDDGLSGLDPATQPTDSTVTGEGRNLTAGPVTVRDRAGNASDPASVSGIRIDRTAPVITGGPTTSANAAGWYKDEVTVDFGCADPALADDSAGSGVALCPTSKVIKGDGANQAVTSDVALDVAGNTRAGKTVSGINVDGTAPVSTSNNQCTKTNGWCTGPTANVVLSATDQAGLSGVREIHYRIDGGTEQVAAGTTKSVSVPLDGTGSGSVSYWAVDNAGNVESPNSVALKWDNIAPTVTHSLSPRPNADDWNNADVTVHFAAKDDDAGSGVEAGSVTEDVVVTAETAGRVVNGSAKDTAGNLGTDAVSVKLDKTSPTITGVVTSGALGDDGWYVGPVTVRFTCGDALSGVATCPDPVILTQNGANAATGTATDKAGNSASATVAGIHIDQEKPTLTAADVNVAGATFTLGAVPNATCVAKDYVSGMTSCRVTVTGGNANAVGMFTYSATAVDRAGNTTTITGTFKVAYRFDGFLQPINDTAHQVGTTTSVFKAGSTVPAKLQLKKADGSLVQAAASPVWPTPAKGSAMTAPVDESVYAATADSGSTYRYDAVAQQYIFNWKTGASGGNYWRVGVTLDDGQTYFVNIGLR